MNNQTIIHQLTENYASFIDYINSLSPAEYSFSAPNKWNAAQQLEHTVLCVKPLVQVFSMDKIALKQTFGSTDKPGRTYDGLLGEYLVKLNDGGKAPERFVPKTTAPEQRAALCETLNKSIEDLCSKIETFSDQELDTLQIPHPLLGNITLREMLYNAIYHVKHHQAQIEENLKGMKGSQ
jgi:DinB family protein